MPNHGHWVADEAWSGYAAGRVVEFRGTACGDSARGTNRAPGAMCLDEWAHSLFPMKGVYRLRVWLDFPDRDTVKTAVDFTVSPGDPLSPRLVD